jgi:hypothetical protein
MASTAPTTETIDQARIRLAQKARESGVKVRIGSDGRFFVSSASRFGHEHFVTGWSCDCDGFARHGRCMHHSAVLACIGWLPTADGPGDTAKQLETAVATATGTA